MLFCNTDTSKVNEMITMLGGSYCKCSVCPLGAMEC